MAEVTTLQFAGAQEARVSRVEAPVKMELDPGPWLFFAAPASFVVTLLVVCWFSITSFF